MSEPDIEEGVKVVLEPISAAPVEKPYAEVRRIGKFRYAIWIKHETPSRVMRIDPWTVFGHDRAIKKGVKELRKYVKWLDRVSNKEKITL